MFHKAWVIGEHTYRSYLKDQGTQLAAAISYYVLVSLVPIVIVAVAVLGFIFTSEARRDDVVDYLVDVLPLSEETGRQTIENAIDSVRRLSGPVAVFGFIGALWGSSGMFTSIRKALNRVWGVDEHRPFLQAKLVDFGQLGLLGLVMVASIAATGVLRYMRTVSSDYFEFLHNANVLWEIPAVLIPAFLTLVTFSTLYRIVPASKPTWQEVIPGAILASVLFEILKNTFAIYVANFNNFDVVYGSLAGIFLFLFYVFMAAQTLLIGAELSKTVRNLQAGALDAQLHPAEPPPSIPQQILQAVKGMFVKTGP